MTAADPYLAVAEATSFIDYLPEYRGGEPLDWLVEVDAEGLSALQRASSEGKVRFNAAHLPSEAAADRTYFVTVNMSREQLSALPSGALLAFELAEGLRHQRTLWPKRSVALLPAGERPTHSGKGRVLAGMIDDGCPFAHREFRRPSAAEGQNATRVVTLWDMDPNPQWSFKDARAPYGFSQGCEIPGAVLDHWMAEHTGEAGVDEERCYRSIGYVAVWPELTHGSHLLGRFAGHSYSRQDSAPDAAAEADIAFVQLPRREQEAPGAGSIHAAVIDGMRYLRQYALACGYERCVVVCAKGNSMGSHDGKSLFDRALKSMLDEPGLELHIVFAAGNGYRDKVHAVLGPGKGQPASAQWVLPSDNEVPTFAELWTDRPEETSFFAGRGETLQKLVEGEVISLAVGVTAVRQGAQVVLRAAPTSVSDGHTSPAEPGGVKVRVEATETASVHGYVCWGGKNLGSKRESFQAFWRAEEHESSKVMGAGTLIGDACSMHPKIYVAGGYVGANDPQKFVRSPYSAAGPTRGDRVGPTALAMTDTDATTRGIPGPGTLSGITKRVWGTSVAVPQLARAVLNGETLPARGGETLPDEAEVGGGFLA